MASQSDQVVGALAAALQDARTATEPRRCRRPGKDCARNTSVQSCGHAGGPATERKVALCALRFQNRKIGCVANMTDRFSPVRGSEAATPQVAVLALGIAPAILRHKRGIGHVYGNDCCRVSEENVVKRFSSQRRHRIDGKRFDLSLRFGWDADASPCTGATSSWAGSPTPWG
jgi:hypothetical protein